MKTVQCGECGGDGEIQVPGEAPHPIPCPKCSGTGEVTTSRDPVLFRPVRTHA